MLLTDLEDAKRIASPSHGDDRALGLHRSTWHQNNVLASK